MLALALRDCGRPLLTVDDPANEILLGFAAKIQVRCGKVIRVDGGSVDLWARGFADPPTHRRCGAGDFTAPSREPVSANRDATRDLRTWAWD